MTILIPEKNNNIFRLYHKSSITLIPLCACSYILNKNNIPTEYLFHSFNIINFGFHSYVSTSSIITDYLKNPKISKIARISSLSGHVLGALGGFVFLKNMASINKNNKE
jgi:hypothetical protein|tara:strand:- start:462 stop:788 length:327 start_codon:yes stop_codon:yes gene_type:complete